MSDEDYMEIFPPVSAAKVHERDRWSELPLRTPVDSTMLFILATAVVFSTVFIIAAVVLVVMSK